MAECVVAASPAIVLLLVASVSGAPHTSQRADAAGDAWQEYADTLRGVLCPLDADFLTCVERRVVCELESTVRKLSNFSDAQPWLKYVQDSISDNSSSDGEVCDSWSQERSALASATEESDSVANEDDATLASDAGVSSRDVAFNSSRGSTKETIPRTLKKGMMMPMMLLGPMIMLGFLPFQLANLKGMVMMAMMLSNMALMSAIMTTIRNVVFGRRPGPHVVYKNYGYENEKKHKRIPHHPTVIHHG